VSGQLHVPSVLPPGKDHHPHQYPLDRRLLILNGSLKLIFFVTVLLAVFSYLDDMSLWSVGNVCKRWRHLLHTHVAGEQWRVYTMRRWPLYKPLCAVQDWFKVYTEL